jgi:hypothetical protein
MRKTDLFNICTVPQGAFVACPLWVISGHRLMFGAGPLYP